MALALGLGWFQLGGMIMGFGGWLTALNSGLWLGLGLVLVCIFGRPLVPRAWAFRPPSWFWVLRSARVVELDDGIGARRRVFGDFLGFGRAAGDQADRQDAPCEV